MTAHVIEAGPNTIRQLCCGDGEVTDGEVIRAALDGIDDPAVLVELRPVSVDSLWREALRSVHSGRPELVIVVHPSWWATTRVDRVRTAAEVLADDIEMRPRSWLLARAAAPHMAVVVEIVDQFVVVTGEAVVAERRRDPQRTADAIVQSIVEMAADATAVVVIDAPGTVDGANGLATMIADGVRACDAMKVVLVEDAALRELGAAAVPSEDAACESPSTDAADGGRRGHRIIAVVILLVTVVLAVGALHHHPVAPVERAPTTFLVEGRVALEVPAQWPMQRVIAGPGSARVQVTSPSDPEVALHVTQSRVAAATLDDAAESLKQAIDAEPPGVFVDFNPAGRSAGRPAVTYREVRAGHDIRWTVLLDRAVRISIGCQSRPGHDDVVRDVCEQAVRTARTLS